MSPKLDGLERTKLVEESFGREGRAGVERDAEQVEPRLSLGVAGVVESGCQLRRDVRAGTCRRGGKSEERGECATGRDGEARLVSDIHRT
jgi:hypothetical protein